RPAGWKRGGLQGQSGGAAGTLAWLGPGEESLGSLAELARELGLAEPAITWHVARDGIAETVQFLALLGASLGKIAFDVMLMSATEVGEAAEPFVSGRGSSSTMPQKRNPISCELILAASKALRQHAGRRSRAAGRFTTCGSKYRKWRGRSGPTPCAA